jgi:hypothetical protein
MPSKGAGPIETPLALQVRAKALTEMDLVKERMRLHEQTCSVCNPKVKAAHSSK